MPSPNDILMKTKYHEAINKMESLKRDVHVTEDELMKKKKEVEELKNTLTF